MPGVYANTDEADSATIDRFMHVLQTRGSDRQQLAMMQSYSTEISSPESDQEHDAGCEVGVQTSTAATLPGVVSNRACEFFDVVACASVVRRKL